MGWAMQRRLIAPSARRPGQHTSDARTNSGRPPAGPPAGTPVVIAVRRVIQAEHVRSRPQPRRRIPQPRHGPDQQRLHHADKEPASQLGPSRIMLSHSGSPSDQHRRQPLIFEPVPPARRRNPSQWLDPCTATLCRWECCADSRSQSGGRTASGPRKQCHLIARSISLSAEDLLFEYAFLPELTEEAHGEIWLNMFYDADTRPQLELRGGRGGRAIRTASAGGPVRMVRLLPA